MGEPEVRLTPVEYAVYGVVTAAKRETGPGGARRMCRIQERLHNWDDAVIENALRRLMELGWIRQMDPIMGMIHYELADHG